MTSFHNCAGATGEQVLQLNNERFMVPEALFHPSDIGLNQAGKQSIHCWLQQHLDDEPGVVLRICQFCRPSGNDRAGCGSYS
jgi:hypothetical protein